MTMRIGLVGYGKGGSIFHAPFIASAPECEFAGVVTASPERRAELAPTTPVCPRSTRSPTLSPPVPTR